MGIDLLIDSNNDGVISSSDDSIEDLPGSDARPGKVILVNDSDLDADGLPDHVDGFDHLPTIPDDDSSSTTLTPLLLNLSGTSSGALIRISYSASDPQGIGASLDQPFILPSGSLRIWTADGHVPRDAAPVREGGHYFAPGTYTLAELGLAAGGTATLFVEAVTESVQTADQRITVELDPTGASGFVLSDEVRLTSVRVELLGRNYDESTYSLVSGGIVTDPTLSNGFTIGSYQTHILRVYDPRSSLSSITVEGQSISLIDQGGYYQTGEFQLIDGTAAGPYINVALVGTDLDWSYNPSGKKGVSAVAELNEWDTELADTVKQAVDAMEGEGWAPADPKDAGAFGKEVHMRTRLALQGTDGWLAEVYIENNTNKILSFGDPPDGVPSSSYTQVDFIRTKYQGLFSGYYTPGVGDILDHTQVEDVYDIKTSLSGSMTADQKNRLKSVLNGWGNPQTRDIKVMKTHLRWTENAGWHPNPKYRNGLRILALFGAATAAWAMFDFSGQQEAWERVTQDAARIKQETQPEVKLADTILWIKGPVSDYLAYFIPSDDIRGVATTVVAYKILAEWEVE